MKVIRCKDCALQFRSECPMVYIENKELCFLNKSPMFYCAKGCPKDDYIPTNGDAVRNMTDRQLAEYINQVETDAYNHGRNGLKWNLGEGNVKFYIKWFGTVEGEDCE